MSSTNVHSNQDKHICCGQTIPKEPEENLEMPPQSAGRGPTVIEVLEGPNTEIPASDNITARDENDHEKIGARAICDDGTDYNNLDNLNIKQVVVVMVGQIAAVKQALDEQKAKKSSKNTGKDRE